MPIEIQHENTFKSALSQGVNLFLGAGFSLYAEDHSGKTLPTGAGLGRELASKFELSDSLSLSQMSAILKATRAEEFEAYLRMRFRVLGYSTKYKTLNSINIRNILTTNIDDLVYRIFEDSDKFYVNDVTLRGPSIIDRNAIDYVPLHGCVRNDSREFVFTPAELAAAFNRDRDTFQVLRDCLKERPTIFWGYGLEDADIIQALFDGSQTNYENKWIVLREVSSSIESYFRALGFNIIQGDTEGLLEYIDGLSADVKPAVNTTQTLSKMLDPYTVPNVGSVPVRPGTEFFLGASPKWWDIFSDIPFKTHHFENVVDEVDSGKNIIVVGIHASGKTTLMLQTANRFVGKGKIVLVAHEHEPLTKEKMSMICEELNGKRVIFFLDNFSDDMDVIRELLSHSNIQIVAFDREYNYEIVSHLLPRSAFKVLHVTDLDDTDMQGVYHKIPASIRKPQLERRKDETSLFDFIERNVIGPRLHERIDTVIKQLNSSGRPELVDFFVMCCYVHSCRTLVSFDVAMAFLRDDIKGYEDVFAVRETLGSLIKDDVPDYIEKDQDYFRVRSTTIAETLMRRVPTSILNRVLKKFYDNVSPWRIPQYHIFKRYAYDYKTISRAFLDWQKGMQFYESRYQVDKSPYLLQQGALYLAYKHQFTEAFQWIDLALRSTKNEVFSIRNSHAIILFDANIRGSNDDSTVRSTLNSSMDILRTCYIDDKRKTYHALKFAEQALQFYEKYGDDEGITYMVTALEWLGEEKFNSAWHWKVPELIRELRSTLTKAGMSL